MKTYLVVLPAYNEEQSIHSVVEEIRRSLPSADILVVDDGSTDRTGAIAREDSVQVITHPFNLGYGAAISLIASGASSIAAAAPRKIRAFPGSPFR
jgi:glycosyltransferase involved in cell wall biosynthesis